MERPEVRAGVNEQLENGKGGKFNNDFVERRRGGGKEGAVLL